MAHISKIDRWHEKEKQDAAQNRREIIAAQLSRRELVKMGLLATAGLIVAKKGLSARAISRTGFAFDGQPKSPPTRAFVEEMPRLTIKKPVASLNPAPTAVPNKTGSEGRSVAHQFFLQYPPQKFYEMHQQAGQVSMSPDLPLQNIWGFDGITPGPLFVAHYQEPIIVRQRNNLPLNNGGFGKPSVTTHLHNGHTPPESDGFPCFFFERGQFYDYYYPHQQAGFASDYPPYGSILESSSTLWYHDLRLGFSAQNTYKGLLGMYNLFNQFDTGNETTGFRLPSFPDFDINMVFSDKVFDRNTGLMAFDAFNLDGILGDKFLVNGKINPVLHVSPRRYRFRWLNAGPSRFYQLFLTDLNQLSAHNRFWQMSVDGNLLPTPILVESCRFAVGERVDVIVDFKAFAGKTLYLENRLEQQDGRGPTGKVWPAGQGNLILKIIVDGPMVRDNSGDPVTEPPFYHLPSTTATPLV